MKKTAKRTKQTGFRFTPEIKQFIADAAKAAGITQTAFIEKCIRANLPQAIKMTDAERELLRSRLKHL